MNTSNGTISGYICIAEAIFISTISMYCINHDQWAPRAQGAATATFASRRKGGPFKMPMKDKNTTEPAHSTLKYTNEPLMKTPLYFCYL